MSESGRSEFKMGKSGILFSFVVESKSSLFGVVLIGILSSLSMTTFKFRVPNVWCCIIVFVYSKNCIIICAIFCPVWIGSNQTLDAAGLDP